METIESCELCGAAATPLLATFDRFGDLSLRPYRIGRCAGCGFTFLMDRPAAVELLASHQQEEYDPFLSLKRERGLYGTVYELMRDRNLRWKHRLIRRRLRPGRLLDIGCGTGEFVLFMRERGWDAAGMEPSAPARAFLQRRGAPVFADIPEQGAYDLVTMWHSLEHIPDLGRAAAKAAGLVAESGLLVIAVPNIDSADFRAYGPCWVALDAPRHLHHFRVSDLDRLFAPHGLARVGQRSLPFDVLYNALESEKLKARADGAGSLAALARAAVRGAGLLAAETLRPASAASICHIFMRRRAAAGLGENGQGGGGESAKPH